MNRHKVQKLIEAINTYYAFVVLVYAAAVYVARHNHLFFWLAAAATPLLAGWTGYLLHSFVQRRYQRYGFRVLEDTMTYELIDRQRSRLRFAPKLRADADHLIVFPISYQWSGDGKESVPELLSQGQQLMGVIHGKADGTVQATPYEEIVASEGRWKYWLIGLKKPAYKGDIVEVAYQQHFFDGKKHAKPELYYKVRTPMRFLELNVKFAADMLPDTVSGSYSKPSDPRHEYASEGVDYDPNKQWATWRIENPKRGYCYRIHWQ